MTNREYLDSLPDNEWYDFITYDLVSIGKKYTSSKDGILEWLKQEYLEPQPTPFNCAFYENELRILSEDDEGQSFSDCKVVFKDLDGNIYNITGFDKGE